MRNKKEKQRKEAVSEASVTDIAGNTAPLFFSLPTRTKQSSEDKSKHGKIPKV